MDIQAIWDQACVVMHTEMTEITFNTWIKAALRPMDAVGDQFYIEAVTDFYYSFVVPRYAVLIGNSLSEVVGRPIKAKILTPQQAEKYRAGAAVEEKPADSANLNPKYTFDTFVVGGNNRFAHAAALAVAESPADTYNPLFIYGGVGLGKTHLVHAIGHYILSQKPSMRIKYVTCELFMNEMVNALNKKTQAEFREKYRNIDVLIVDDVQFLTGKMGTQEEFFHTFNTLHTAGKQIIMTSDKPPRDIVKLEERLVSRFEWGLIADISKPDLETRAAILKRKAEEEMLNVDDTVLTMIAERVTNNVRELEGSLTRLVAYSSLTGRPVDKALAEDALREIFARSEPRHVTCEDVMESVAAYYNVTTDDLKGARRSRDVATPRQIAMYISREVVGAPLTAIGDSFGGRDHSTVNHACQKVAADMKASPSLNTLIHDLMQKLQER
ncbi:MAG: chromosomal replication initiator protein DnaA [Clostridia bacterium]|nr:chromosomal replication initiator protein DnaA [Clostridia bacterium]MBR0408982.1 chromosomal replication initiator protein DnaA [Clostridia bacterium]